MIYNLIIFMSSGTKFTYKHKMLRKVINSKVEVLQEIRELGSLLIYDDDKKTIVINTDLIDHVEILK